MEPLFKVVAKVADLGKHDAEKLQDRLLDFLLEQGWEFQISVSVEYEDTEEDNE